MSSEKRRDGCIERRDGHALCRVLSGGFPSGDLDSEENK